MKTGISARFAARFADFSGVPETVQLMRERVAHGQADHLVAERVAGTGTRADAGKPSRCLRRCASAARCRALPETELDVELRIGVSELGSDPN